MTYGLAASGRVMYVSGYFNAELILMTNTGLSARFQILCGDHQCEYRCETVQLIEVRGFAAQPVSTVPMAQWPDGRVEDKIAETYDLNPLQATIATAELREQARPGIDALFQAHLRGHGQAAGYDNSEYQATLRDVYPSFSESSWTKARFWGGSVPVCPRQADDA